MSKPPVQHPLKLQPLPERLTLIAAAIGKFLATSGSDIPGYAAALEKGETWTHLLKGLRVASLHGLEGAFNPRHIPIGHDDRHALGVEGWPRGSELMAALGRLRQFLDDVLTRTGWAEIAAGKGIAWALEGTDMNVFAPGLVVKRGRPGEVVLSDDEESGLRWILGVIEGNLQAIHDAVPPLEWPTFDQTSRTVKFRGRTFIIKEAKYFKLLILLVEARGEVVPTEKIRREVKGLPEKLGRGLNAALPSWFRPTICGVGGRGLPGYWFDVAAKLILDGPQ